MLATRTSLLLRTATRRLGLAVDRHVSLHSRDSVGAATERLARMLRLRSASSGAVLGWQIEDLSRGNAIRIVARERRADFGDVVELSGEISEDDEGALLHARCALLHAQRSHMFRALDVVWLVVLLAAAGWWLTRGGGSAQTGLVVVAISSTPIAMWVARRREVARVSRALCDLVASSFLRG